MGKGIGESDSYNISMLTDVPNTKYASSRNIRARTYKNTLNPSTTTSLFFLSHHSLTWVSYIWSTACHLQIQSSSLPLQETSSTYSLYNSINLYWSPKARSTMWTQALPMTLINSLTGSNNPSNKTTASPQHTHIAVIGPYTTANDIRALARNNLNTPNDNRASSQSSNVTVVERYDARASTVEAVSSLKRNYGTLFTSKQPRLVRSKPYSQQHPESSGSASQRPRLMTKDLHQRISSSILPRQ